MHRRYEHYSSSTSMSTSATERSSKDEAFSTAHTAFLPEGEISPRFDDVFVTQQRPLSDRTHSASAVDLFQMALDREVGNRCATPEDRIKSSRLYAMDAQYFMDECVLVEELHVLCTLR